MQVPRWLTSFCRVTVTIRARREGPAISRRRGQAAALTEEVDALAAALAHGPAAKVDFLAVHETDVVNPAMQCELQRVASH